MAQVPNATLFAHLDGESNSKPVARIRGSGGQRQKPANSAQCVIVVKITMNRRHFLNAHGRRGGPTFSILFALGALAGGRFNRDDRLIYDEAQRTPVAT